MNVNQKIVEDIAAARITADMATRVLASVAEGAEVTDARITAVTTGYGRYTAHHFADSDYIVDVAVVYEDRPDREYSAVYGILDGEPVCWLD